MDNKNVDKEMTVSELAKYLEDLDDGTIVNVNIVWKEGEADG